MRRRSSAASTGSVRMRIADAERDHAGRRSRTKRITKDISMDVLNACEIPAGGCGQTVVGGIRRMPVEHRANPARVDCRLPTNRSICAERPVTRPARRNQLTGTGNSRAGLLQMSAERTRQFRDASDRCRPSTWKHWLRRTRIGRTMHQRVGKILDIHKTAPRRRPMPKGNGMPFEMASIRRRKLARTSGP